ncbi:MAG TPA: hypothetical protein VF041_22655 [Gemmatimonadaceae bacterium]
MPTPMSSRATSRRASACRDHLRPGVARALAVALALPMAAVPAAALAQDTIAPGNPALRIDRVRLATDTIVVLITPTDSAERLGSTLVRRIERVRSGPEELFRETQHYLRANGDVEDDTLEMSARTLAFRRIVEVYEDTARNVVRSDGERLTGFVTFPDSGRREVSMPAVPFFHDMVDEAFIGALPLDSGVTILVPLIVPPRLDVHVLPFTVTGTETIRTADGPVACLVVKGPGKTTTAWLAATDHHLVRLRWTLPNGTSIWKLPKRDANFRSLS